MIARIIVPSNDNPCIITSSLFTQAFNMSQIIAHLCVNLSCARLCTFSNYVSDLKAWGKNTRAYLFIRWEFHSLQGLRHQWCNDVAESIANCWQYTLRDSREKRETNLEWRRRETFKLATLLGGIWHNSYTRILLFTKAQHVQQQQLADELRGQPSREWLSNDVFLNTNKQEIIVV